MEKVKVRIQDIVTFMNLEVKAGEQGLSNSIAQSELTTPGVELAGHFEFFEPRRVIVLGKREKAIWDTLNDVDKNERVDRMFREYPPCFIFSKDVEPMDIIVDKGNYFNTPVLKSDLSKTSLSAKLHSYLTEKLAERTSIHGVFLDIHGIGVVIKGRSGLGKSEVALELIGKGHTLIADDRVDVYEKEPGLIIGEAPAILKKYIEIRGIGVVNVVDMFGVGSFRNSKSLKLIVELEEWGPNTTFDRLGLEDRKEKLFHTDISVIKIPVSTGRNIASIVEAATMNFKLKNMGYNAAEEFNRHLQSILSGDSND